MTQLDLFHIPAEAPAQSHSPTSVQASINIRPKLPSWRKRVYDYISLNGPVTDEELIAGLCGNPSTIRPRRIELYKSNLIEPAGQKLTLSGQQATAWQVRK